MARILFNYADNSLQNSPPPSLKISKQRPKRRKIFCTITFATDLAVLSLSGQAIANLLNGQIAVKMNLLPFDAGNSPHRSTDQRSQGAPKTIVLRYPCLGAEPRK